ncbi:TPA: sensor histidine kinase, partial [Stenotrophomonas maltophilia]|nr:sensor histidine kinase [Stenotrophomonas maltophilia]
MARPTRPIRSITLGLAWRLFLAQAFTVLFAVVALILTWGDKDTWGMDMFMAEAVAKAVHSEGGRLVLDQARWNKLDAEAGGNLWFA